MTDQAPVTRTYRNEQLAVLWQPALCTHCEACWRGLPEVFDMNARPWVKIDGATPEEIANQIDECPSGALSYTWND